MNSIVDPDSMFQSVPMWMCPSCGRTVTLPFGTSTSMPEHTICHCAGRLGNDGKFYGHYTMMVGNKAGREFDERWRRYWEEKRKADLEAQQRWLEKRRVSQELWGRIYQSLADMDAWLPVAVPSAPMSTGPNA